MRRRGFLLLAAVIAVPLAAEAWAERESAEAVQEAAHEPPEVLTDPAPIRASLTRLGPIVSVHWVRTSSARPGDRLPIGPTDSFYDMVVRLPPGRVTRLLGGRSTAPVSPAPVAAPTLATGPGISAPLVPFVPRNASWERSEELDGSLVSAGSSRLYFDRASDTVYVSATNLMDPTSPSPSPSGASSPG